MAIDMDSLVPSLPCLNRLASRYIYFSGGTVSSIRSGNDHKNCQVASLHIAYQKKTSDKITIPCQCPLRYDRVKIVPFNIIDFNEALKLLLTLPSLCLSHHPKPNPII